MKNFSFKIEDHQTVRSWFEPTKPTPQHATGKFVFFSYSSIMLYKHIFGTLRISC